MIFIDEGFFDNEDEVKVHYQHEDDDENKEVLHDDKECCKDKEDHEEEDDDDKIKIVVKGLDDGDKMKFKLKKSDDEDDEEDESSEDEDSEKENDFMNGREMLRSIHQDPKNLPIVYAEEASKYYIDYNDLNLYMEAVGLDSIEEALNNIIEAHTEDICADNVVVVLPENYTDSFNEAYVDYLEESAVNFEA